MTKAELEKVLEQTKNSLAAALQDRDDAEAALAKFEDFGLLIWNCPNSPGEPICISTDDDDPQNHSVNLYMRGGGIVGVKAYRKVVASLEAACGLVPVEDE